MQAALLNLEAQPVPTPNPSAAYSILADWLDSAAHVGPNVMSEILHTFDNKRFAILNQNSVSGIHMAGFLQFPLRPLKTNVTAAIYEEFCEKAELVRAGLGLKDLSELDAVFNYAYVTGLLLAGETPASLTATVVLLFATVRLDQDCSGIRVLDSHGRICLRLPRGSTGRG